MLKELFQKLSGESKSANVAKNRLKVIRITSYNVCYTKLLRGLPGLIVDKFDKHLSVQFRNSGIEVFRKEVINALKKVIKPT